MNILVSAYACEPDKGSESAVGWNWVLQAARFHDVWVITRANNEPAISAFLARSPLPNVHWVYYDLPPWSRFWKRKRQGVHAYYHLWQLGAFRLAVHLHRKTGFDVVHHATFANYWMPSFLAFLPVPFVWGPVGGAESAPAPFYRTFALRPRTSEYLRDLVRKLAGLTPLTRAIVRRSAVALATTPETAAVLTRLGGRRVQIVSQVALDSAEYSYLSRLPVRTTGPLRMLSIGTLLHLKGFHLGLIAFAEFRKVYPDAEYWVIGEGPERARLMRLADELALTRNVRFLGQLPRTAVMDALGECDVLIHPSLHDSGGFVCIEALAAGRPAICLDLGGPAVLIANDCGFKVAALAPDQVCRDLTAAMRTLAGDPVLRQRQGEAARARVREFFSWDSKGSAMNELYHFAAASRMHSSGGP